MAQKKVDRQTRKLFKGEQADMFEKSYEEELEAKRNQKVECIGMTFENDDARREHFLGILREKLKDPEFRKIEGFPIGEDEDILALSDPPYYTACPNPFIEDFIKHYGKPYESKTDNYKREPFAADVSEGKNDPIYNAHSYHTKVPHKAIMRYILHYTKPGDIIFDGFCGTGMTGVAAQMCGDRATVESLGYRVTSNGTILKKENDETGKGTWVAFTKLGVRRAVLNDLSSVATFIAYNHNRSVDVSCFEREAKRVCREVEKEYGWMYETKHSDGGFGKINYTVWSDVFVCPGCTGEIVFWDCAVDRDAGRVNHEFSCPHCNVSLSKSPSKNSEAYKLERAWVTIYDPDILKATTQAKQVPVLIDYILGNRRYQKKPDIFDFNLIQSIADKQIKAQYPTSELHDGIKFADPKSIGVSHIHHFYTKRNLLVLSSLWDRSTLRGKIILTSFMDNHANKRNRYLIDKHHTMGTTGGPLTNTLYFPPLSCEINLFNVYLKTLKKYSRAFQLTRNIKTNIVSTGSATAAPLCKNNSIDYIFIDPPFGGNLMYSELNVIWESWLKVKTNAKPEAIENSIQEKGLSEYQTLMRKSFEEYFRLLRPGRWMTIEFHNSKNSVWMAIQQALQNAGFVIADVRTLDKKHTTIHQDFAAGAVKQDLVITVYKPNDGFENRFKLSSGIGDGVWDFIRTHLNQLPIFVSKNGQAEVISERQNYLLFDRMVAFHVQRGVTVPLSAAEFYTGLEQRFPPRDGMYFLPDQAAEYDRKRMTVKEILQLQLFVTDEASSIQWLRQQFTRKPQSFQDIHPQFMKEIGGWQKHEKPLELSKLLEQNFLCYDGQDDVPSQIHSYLSTNFKELRNLSKDDPALQDKGKDRWYVPDPNKSGDLEKLRERALLREFREYHESKQKRLKVFRLEAVRAGFKKAWQEKDYTTIIEVAKKIKENVLQEDPKLLMFYDQALTRSEQS